MQFRGGKAPENYALSDERDCTICGGAPHQPWRLKAWFFGRNGRSLIGEAQILDDLRERLVLRADELTELRGTAAHRLAAFPGFELAELLRLRCLAKRLFEDRQPLGGQAFGGN